MLNIGIIGAGIGGLTSAIMLRKSGHNITIFEKQKDLKEQIKLLSEKSSAIDMSEIIAFQKEEKKFDELSIDVEEVLRNDSFCTGIINSKILIDYFNNPEIERLLSLLDCTIELSSLKNFFNLQTKIFNVSKKIDVTKEMLRFGKFKSSQIDDLRNYIDDYEKAFKIIESGDCGKVVLEW